MRKTMTGGLLVAMLATSAAAGSLDVTTGDTWRPYIDEAEAQGGTITLFVKKVLEEMGHNGKMVHLPWARSYEMARRDRFIATFPWYRSEERRAHMHYSQPLAVLKNVVFVRKGEEAGLASWDDVEAGTLCRPVGYTILPQIKAKLEIGSIELAQPPSMGQCMKMLAGKRVDYVMTIEEVGEQTIAAAGLPLGSFAKLAEPVERSAVHLLVSKTHPQGKDFLARFNAAMAALRESGVTVASAGSPQ